MSVVSVARKNICGHGLRCKDHDCHSQYDSEVHSLASRVPILQYTIVSFRSITVRMSRKTDQRLIGIIGRHWVEHDSSLAMNLRSILCGAKSVNIHTLRTFKPYRESDGMFQGEVVRLLQRTIHQY